VDAGRARKLAGAGTLFLLGSVLVTALEGPHWWAVAGVLLSALAMIVGLLAWAIARKGSRRVQLGPFVWEGTPEEQEEEVEAGNPHSADPLEPRIPWWRRWLHRPHRRRGA
jgi:hypothetical protein